MGKMKKLTTTCPLDCPDACGALAEVDEQGRLVRLVGNPDHSWSAGQLCGKTAIAHEMVNSPQRLMHPLIRAGGELRRASWDEALDRIAAGIEGLSGEELLALNYAGNMGLVGRGFPMRLMHQLGATTTDGGICDNTANAGYEAILGHVVGPDIEEAADADVLWIWGCDARRTQQHLMPRARQVLRRGGQVAVLDIYETDTMRQVRSWGGRGFVLRPGTDAALAMGLVARCFEEGREDRAFLEDHCVGVAELRAAAQRDSLVQTGLSTEELEELWSLLTRARRPFWKLGVGWTRRRFGGSSMRAVCALASVLGQVERLHFQSSDHFGLEDDSVRQPWRRPDPDPARTIRHVELGAELASERLRAAFVWGHNPVVTVPDTGRVRAGLESERMFLVVHELFLTETARIADVVLPAAAWVETSDVYRSYGHRLLHYARKASRTHGEQRSNVAAFGALAQRLGMPQELWDVEEDQLCQDLLRANVERIGEGDLARLLEGEPVKLAPRSFADRGTPSGKIELASARAQEVGEPAVAPYRDDAGSTEGRFWLLTAPSIATHNSTYVQVTRHQKRAGKPRVFVRPEDARGLGCAEGARLRLKNQHGSLALEVAYDEGMPAGIVRIDGLPRAEDMDSDCGVNVLTSPGVSDLGEGNVLYSTRVDLELAEG